MFGQGHNIFFSQAVTVETRIVPANRLTGTLCCRVVAAVTAARSTESQKIAACGSSYKEYDPL
jgi:hypothetical protein